LGKEKNPENPEKTTQAMDLEDQTQYELWDIRLGPAIWRRLVKLFPEAIREEENKIIFQYYIYTNIINLPSKEFLILMKEVIGNSPKGKQLIDAMYYDLSRHLDNEEVTEEDSEFRKLLDELTVDTPDEELGNFLADLGITLNESRETVFEQDNNWSEHGGVFKNDKKYEEWAKKMYINRYNEEPTTENILSKLGDIRQNIVPILDYLFAGEQPYERFREGLDKIRIKLQFNQ